MNRLAWAGIGGLWLGAAMLLVLIVSNAADGAATVEAETDVRHYTFVAFVSPRTAELLADPPDDSRSGFVLVEAAEEATAALVSGEVDGIVLDTWTASEMPLDVLQAAYGQSYLIVAFEVRPSQILRGGCENQRPCVGNLHEDEPAVAYSRRTATGFGAGETVVHSFSPRFFHTVLTLRADNARGIAIGGPATPSRSQ